MVPDAIVANIDHGGFFEDGKGFELTLTTQDGNTPIVHATPGEKLSVALHEHNRPRGPGNPFADGAA